MNKKLSILVLIITFALSAMAQKSSDFIEVIHLKNGQVVKGIIVEQIPGKAVKIRTSEGEEMVYFIEQIAKFTREEKTVKSTIFMTDNASTSEDKVCCSKNSAQCAGKTNCPKGKKSCADGKTTCSKDEAACSIEKKQAWQNHFKKKEKGYFAEIGFLRNATADAFRVTNGYKFGRLGYLGLAVGLENVDLVSAVRIPELSLNIVYAGDITDKKITPFYQLEAGYGFSLDRYGYNQRLFNTTGFGGDEVDEFFFDENAAAILNYGGPQGAFALGVKINTLKKIYFKFGVDARLNGNFSDVHAFTFDDLGAVTGTELLKSFTLRHGLGARFTFGF